MAQLGQRFDANTVDPSAPRGEILAPGKYPAQIVLSTMKTTNKGGQALELEFDLLGEHNGRKVWDRLNLVNANAQAEEIAHRALSAICHAVGEMQVDDSEQLHFKPLLLTLGVEVGGPRTDGKPGTYPDKNVVKGYEKLDGSVASAPAQRSTQPTSRPAYQQPAQTQAAAEPARAKKPWEK